MEDIVAVAVGLDTHAQRYFLTWGRIQDRVDPAPLEALILRVSPRFALGGTPVAARLCASLQDAADQPYFYECFFAMCQKSIPRGARYADWIEQTRHAMEAGREIYYLDQPSTSRRP